MAWNLVQATSALATSDTYASTTTAGSLLQAWIIGYHSAGAPIPNSVTDTQGNSWSQGPTVTALGGILRVTEFHCVNSGARASDVVTANYSTTPDLGNLIAIAEFTGNVASSPYDQGSGVNTSPGSTATNGDTTSSVTTTTNGQLITGFIANAVGANWTGVTPGTSPITFIEAHDGGANSYELEYGVQASAGAITAKWTAQNTDGYVALIATFKAPAAYTLACDQGSFALTGQALALKADRTLPAAQGSFALTGQALALSHGYKMTADQGSFSMTGEAVGLAAARLLAMGQGAFVLTGQDAGLLAARIITIEQGAFVLSGQDVTLVYTPVGAYLLTAEGGTFALSGQDAALLAARRITAEQGSYIVAGQDVSFVYAVLGSVFAYIPTFRRRRR